MATKGIPYGLSDYVRLATENYYYVDKTRFIPLIEQVASFIFFIRPRRFGKSLLLSVLHSYYDINKSLLYYFGLLTISGVERGNVVLSIPNQTVREQLYTYLIDTCRQAELFTIDLNKLSLLMEGMAYDGTWQPVFAYIGEELKQQSRIREFIDGEADDPASRIEVLRTEARRQLLQYASDPIVTQTIGSGVQLRLITVVFRTWEVVAMEEVQPC